METGTPSLFQLVISITERCNLSCPNCYGKKEEPKSLSLHDINNLLENTKDMGIIDVSLTGGEPLLHEQITEIISLIGSYGYNVHLATNGTITPPQSLIDKILKDRIKISVQVAVYGHRDIHDAWVGLDGSYDTVLENISLLKNVNIPLSITFVATKENFHYIKSLSDPFNDLPININRHICNDKNLELTKEELREICDFVQENSGIRMFCEPLFNTLLIDKASEKLSGYDIRGGCIAGVASATLDPNKEVYPCPKLRISCGNISETPFLEIWQNSRILNMLRDRKNIKVCSDCLYRNVCGGCRASAYLKTGDYLAQDPQCWLK
ncbi:radical SAM protein [Methanoculleus sp. FWC-SCC1]|uniref:Radical SAM protein n=1 Tax=Methanoculleus frigidifontis TaxID=2584085 RepID=A0ABT8MEA7_9EURY|nr:radical SAM protein [Methanoculleus sp. FWC-SCC1]MDN7026236.1 radical SAM protein [Methanoculleus sp. FWC-SCC1]